MRAARTPAIVLVMWVAAASVRAQPAADPPFADLDPSRVALPGGHRIGDLPPADVLSVGGGPPITLGTVLDAVERHHPLLERARLGVRAAEGERLAAEGGFDLGVSAQGFVAPLGYYTWGRADIRLEQPTELWGASFAGGWRLGRGDVPPYYGQHATLTGGELWAALALPLWQNGPIDARRARLWRAHREVEAEGHAVDASRLLLARDASRAYWRWVADGLRYGVALELLRLAEVRDVQVRERVSAGALPAVEALENRRAILARRRVLVGARRALEQSAIGLSLFLRRRDGSPLVAPAARVPPAIELPAEVRISDARAIQLALARRPELARYRALVERGRIGLALAENRLAPRIDVAFGASVDIGDGSIDEQTRLAPPVIEGSVLVSFPLQFRDARGQIDRSRAELGSLRAEARWVREQIAAEVRNALAALRAAEENVRLAHEEAAVARALADAELRRFELGDTQLFIVNLREQAAAEARAAEIDARAELLAAHAVWRAAMGER